MKIAFHTPLPIVVSSRKRGRGMRSIPAGMETTLRISGTQRPNSTILPPCFEKTFSPRSRSFWLVMKNQGLSASARRRS